MPTVFGTPLALITGSSPLAGVWCSPYPGRSNLSLKSQILSTSLYGSLEWSCRVLQAKRNETLIVSIPGRSIGSSIPLPKTWRCRTLGETSGPPEGRRIPPASVVNEALGAGWLPEVSPTCEPVEADPLYLFACHIAWEREEDPSAGWELIAAAQSTHGNTRAPGACSAFQFTSSWRTWFGGCCRLRYFYKTAACRGGRYEGTVWG